MTPILPFLTLAHAAEPPTLDELRWAQRLIVVHAVDADDPRVAATADALATRAADARDRKLQLVTILAGNVHGLDASPAALAEHWSIALEAPYEALLVGLDGTVKARTTEAVDLDAWFERIDGMPMRRAELERRGDPAD